MKSIVTKQDMALVGKIFKFTSPETLPISFTYNGTKYHGISHEWNPTVERALTDANLTTFIIRAKVDPLLEIKVEVKEYRDYPVVEFVAFFTNTGDRDTPVLSDIRIAEGVIEGENPLFIHGNGELQEEEGFEWYRDPMDSPEKKFFLHTDDGTSCNGAYPYMRLMFDGFGVNLALGWLGSWKGNVDRVESGVFVSFGQNRCRFVIRPGETMRTPRVDLQAFCGDESRGRQMWRRWYFDHIHPKEKGQPLPPLLCMHVFAADGHPEFTGATEFNQLRGLDAYLEKGIHPDLWWLDAGWYPCDYSWGKVGTWSPDPERFPNGLAPIGEKCRKEDIRFLLWFEPERAFPDTKLWNEHPEWMIRARDTGKILVDFSNPACRNDMIELVDAMIKESKVDVYRQDLNMVPAIHWTEHEPEDRVGAMENLHIQAVLTFWDSLMERNPGLWIDNCAGGGRRNDLEAMRRGCGLHYSDIGLGNHPMKQKQHRQLLEWVPYFRAQNLRWDDPVTGEYGSASTGKPDRYSYHCALAPAMTDMIEWDAAEEDFALAREMQAIWRRAAEIMLDADYYPLTECRKSREDFYAMYFYNPDEKRGFVQAVRNNACSAETFTAYMTAPDPDVTYRLTNPETGEERVLTGKEMAKGFTMTVEKRAGQIWFFEKDYN